MVDTPATATDIAANSSTLASEDPSACLERICAVNLINPGASRLRKQASASRRVNGAIIVEPDVPSRAFEGTPVACSAAFTASAIVPTHLSLMCTQLGQGLVNSGIP